jgi:hypothetical protein
VRYAIERYRDGRLYLGLDALQAARVDPEEDASDDPEA